MSNKSSIFASFLILGLDALGNVEQLEARLKAVSSTINDETNKLKRFQV